MFHLVLGSENKQCSPPVPYDVRNESITSDHHYPSLCGSRNTKSTLEAQLQLRVKFCLRDNFNEEITDKLNSCHQLTIRLNKSLMRKTT